MVEMRSKHKQIFELEKELELIDTHEMALSQRVKRIEAQLKAKELEDKVKAIHEAITKAHLTLWFNSEGKAPTSVMMRLQDIGFIPSEGKYDFIYDWKQGIGLEEISKLRDTVHKTLRGSKVLYKLETS
jgi:hypothetical protein